MPSVYGQVTATISASGAKTVREGFLHDGDPLDNEYAIPVPKPPYRRQNGEKTTIGLVSVYNKTVEPLSNRGWAFQGKLLSSRVTEYGQIIKRTPPFY
jgi:hypothetical protein